MDDVITGLYSKKQMRIFPRLNKDGERKVRSHPRVKVLRVDHAGFTIVEATLKEDEGVCWECGSIALDPDGKLQRCPICGGFFND